MKKLRAIALSLLAAVLLGASTVYAFANAPEKGSMGVWGYVAGAKYAQLEVADQIGADTLVVSLAKAPVGAWVVVHADDNGMPGERVGLARIDKGDNREVKVELKDVKSEKVIVAIHADRGEPGKFDFDMDDKTGSPDRPFFVGGKELAKAVKVREFGVKDPSGTAAIKVSDQTLSNSTLLVDSAAAPTGAWVVVHLNDNGMPGKRVGVQQIPAGSVAGVAVALDPKITLTPELLVAVHADRGALGTFEFDMDDKLNSPDQPFFVNGKEVATAVKVK
jgi:hypothetical protein